MSRKSTEDEQKQMIAEIEANTVILQGILIAEGIPNPKISWVGMNIFLMDFQSTQDYTNALIILTTTDDGIFYRISEHPNMNRIGLHY